MLILIPTFAMVLDVGIKVFSNIFCPTQTQIHMEIQAEERQKVKLSTKNKGRDETIV